MFSEIITKERIEKLYSINSKSLSTERGFQTVILKGTGREGYRQGGVPAGRGTSREGYRQGGVPKGRGTSREG